MFWNKEEEKININDFKDQFVLPTLPPRKKHFKTMGEMLRDVEKYDNIGEKEVSEMMLNNLSDFIKKLKSDGHENK
jgi:hypothetical protein